MCQLELLAMPKLLLILALKPLLLQLGLLLLLLLVHRCQSFANDVCLACSSLLEAHRHLQLLLGPRLVRPSGTRPCACSSGFGETGTPRTASLAAAAAHVGTLVREV
jgi:hypothetical protein